MREESGERRDEQGHGGRGDGGERRGLRGFPDRQENTRRERSLHREREIEREGEIERER